MAVEKRKRGGNKKKVAGEDLPRMQANVGETQRSIYLQDEASVGG